MTLRTRLDQLPQPNKSYLDAFYRHKLLAGLSEISVKNYLEPMMRFLPYYGLETDLKLITRDDVEAYLFELRSRLKPSTIQSTVISFRVFFSDLLGKEKGNALVEGIQFKVPLVKVREEQLLTHEEIQRMLSCCFSERDRALIALLYSSGCREGEILGLKVQDITFSRNGASIHVNGKTGERDVDLFVGVPELKSWYNVHPHRDNPESPFWVTGRKSASALTKGGLITMLIRVAKRAEIPEGKKINPHSFRHRRATDCAEFLTVADMKEMFGWTDGSNMPAVYVHSSRQRVKEKLMAQAGIKVPEQHMPTMMVKQCPVCGCVNPAEATICYACSNPLNEMDAKGLDVLRKKIEAEVIEKLTKKEDSET